jgi:DNA-binding MarR family transcriptional regulator
VTLEQEDSAGVAALLETMTVLAVRHLAPHDVSFTTAATLGRLARGGPQRLTRLAADEGVAQPSMTQLIQRLERQGLVRRVSDPADGRVRLISITEAGRELIQQRRAARAARLSDLIATLSAEDQLALDEMARIGMPAVQRLMDNAQRLERLSSPPPPP